VRPILIGLMVVAVSMILGPMEAKTARQNGSTDEEIELDRQLEKDVLLTWIRRALPEAKNDIPGFPFFFGRPRPIIN